MADKGIIYIMTTVVPGLIKIGKTGTGQYENRMYTLEHNGYANVTGLQRRYAIEVEDYGEKESLLHEIFNKSRVKDTELFALDVDLAVQLLSSFEGRQVYPENADKEEAFDEATAKRDFSSIPEDVTFYLRKKIKAWDNQLAEGMMVFKDGKFIVKKGSKCCPVRGKGWTSTKVVDDQREACTIKDNILQEDAEFASPSMAAAMITWKPENGWTSWKTKGGKPIDIYRKNK